MNFILIFFIFCITSCSERHPVEYVAYNQPKKELASINLIDRNGLSETISQKERLKQYANVDFLKPQPYQKVLQVYARDAFGRIRALITSYYPNGELKQYLEVVDNRAFGPYREWFSDGQLKLDTTVIGGVADLNINAEKSWLFDGTSKAFDESGNLIATIEYCKGDLTENSLYYHKNGKLWKKIPFTKNLVNGTFEIYLEDGTLLQTAEFVNDIKHGKTVRYWPDNRLAADETYVDGLLLTGLYYDLNGKIAAEIKEGLGFRAVCGKENITELQEYHQGVPDGIVKLFDQKSNLIKIFHVKNEMKHGEEIEFYETLNSGKQQEKILINWCEDKIHGIVKTWYPDGVQESSREMTNNMKNGLLTAWYQDGSVMLLESYDYDKLIKGGYFRRKEKIPVSEVINGNGTATLHDSNGNLLKKIRYYNGKPQD